MAEKQTLGEKRRSYEGPAILSHGFRLFFFLAGLWAAFAVPVWLWLYNASPFPFQTVPAPIWHAHEMIFGYLAAVLAFGSWVAFPDEQGTGALMAFAGVLLALRLLRWKGMKATSEPLVLVLHVGYAWVPVALLLFSGSVFFPSDIPYASALHALTAGAIGLMTISVMTRAALGHSGLPRKADLATSLIYVLIFIAALIRVAAPVLAIDYGQMIMASGVLFSLGFALFTIRYAPIFFGR